MCLATPRRPSERSPVQRDALPQLLLGPRSFFKKSVTGLASSSLCDCGFKIIWLKVRESLEMRFGETSVLPALISF